VTRPNYAPAFLGHFDLDPTEALEALVIDVDWLRVREARREAFMTPGGGASYTYGTGEHARTYVSLEMHPVVERVMRALNSLGASYNACFLNRYDEQRDQLGWHADDSPGQDFGHPIAVVSLGAEREIWWRERGASGVVPAADRQRLASGSLFEMPSGFQQTHQHRIPKSDRPCGVRVSLTFRKFT
jgi:alkylated DNA repair dioxygenase AlkB